LPLALGSLFNFNDAAARKQVDRQSDKDRAGIKCKVKESCKNFGIRL